MVSATERTAYDARPSEIPRQPGRRREVQIIIDEWREHVGDAAAKNPIALCSSTWAPV
jgi:hypothetical protein